MNPYWLEDEPPVAPVPRYDGRVDVAIVGGGVTGCSAALRLAEAGLRVRVYDARGIAEGASGRNGGFALRGGAARYDVARESYGATEAAGAVALDGGEARPAGGARRRRAHDVPAAYRLAADEEERGADPRRVRGAARGRLRGRVARRPARRLDGRFHGAIFHARDASIQPARFVRRLAARAAEAGAELREHERVDDLDALDADQVVVATDGYGHGLVRELAEAIWPTRGQVIVSEPLDRVLYDRPHYARQGFDYWQQLPDGRLCSAASATSRSSTS